MNATRFDTFTRFFANRRVSRRQALGRATGALAAAGLAAPAHAVDAAPAEPVADNCEGHCWASRLDPMLACAE